MADLVITPANVLASAQATVAQGVAAVAILAGQVVYKDVTGKFNLADANGVTPAFKAFGIAQHAAAALQPMQVAIADPLFVVGATLVVGTTYILSGTPGAICPDADA